VREKPALQGGGFCHCRVSWIRKGPGRPGPKIEQKMPRLISGREQSLDRPRVSPEPAPFTTIATSPAHHQSKGGGRKSYCRPEKQSGEDGIEQALERASHFRVDVPVAVAAPVLDERDGVHLMLELITLRVCSRPSNSLNHGERTRGDPDAHEELDYSEISFSIARVSAETKQ
jgi:hypothetical protein